MLTNITDREIIADALSDAPLYKKINLKEGLRTPFDFDNRTFTFFCQNDQSVQTFKLRLEPDALIEKALDHILQRDIVNYIGNRELDESQIYFNFTAQCSGTCQYCGDYKVHFLIRYESLDTEDENYRRIIKIGQHPPYEIKPNRELMKFLSDEDKANYKKAMICKSQSYGIASFAYLRRIVENEMVKLVTALSTLPRAESEDIKKLLNRFREDHNMTNLIEGIYQFLPSSLKAFGNNPLKVLYGQLSGGLHGFSEEECLLKAEDMDIVLNFVVKRIKEEGSEVLEVREALKGLTK